MPTITIYTDGSCHTELRIGGWAALIINEEEKRYLTGLEKNTTHNRMEIIAVIEAIKFATTNYGKEIEIKIFADSQYVVDLPSRFSKLMKNNFITKKGTPIQNEDLVKEFIQQLATINCAFVKVKAHQKPGGIINYNIEVDKLSREVVRKAVKEII